MTLTETNKPKLKMATKTETVSEISDDVISAVGDDITIGNPVTTLAPIGSEISGEFDTSDVTFPKLQIAQGVGPLSDSFDKGAIVLEGEHEIAPMAGDPLEFTVLRISKTFEENIPFGADELPRIASTKADVLALGGTTEWSNGEAPTFKACADALICIKGKDKAIFPYEYNGENYAFATWKIKGVAYNRAAKPIITAASMYYREGLRTGSFMLSTEKAVFNGNTVACPRVVRGNANTEDFVVWLGEFS